MKRLGIKRLWGETLASKTNKKPRRIIALLTDFGTRDWFVSSMKGVIRRIACDAEIVDITHEVEPHNILAASFILESCYRDFMEGTIFCCVVDPGVGTARRRLAATDGSYFFISPDNGLLTGVESQAETFLVYSIENKKLMLEGKGTTFEGRDVFAPAAAHLAEGKPLEDFGALCEDMVRLNVPSPLKTSKGVLRGEVLYIDRFGNLITNISAEDLPKKFDARFAVISIRRNKIKGLAAGYADVPCGALAAYWGSTGRLEIAANQNSAADILKSAIGTKIELIF